MAKECNVQPPAAQDPLASSRSSSSTTHEKSSLTHTLNDYLSIESALSLISARYNTSIISLDDIFSLIPSASSSSSNILLTLLDIGGADLYKLSFCHPDGNKEGVYLELTRVEKRMEILRRKYRDATHFISDAVAARSKSGRSSRNKALIDCHCKMTTTTDGKNSSKSKKSTKKSGIAELFNGGARFDEATKTDTATEGGTINPYENMTLVERVHARARDAKTKLQNEKASTERPDAPRNEFSRLELLRLADALRSRVRLKQSRAAAFRGGASAAPSLLPIKEFVSYFKGVFVGVDDDKVTSRRVLRCLLALMEAVPEWISMERGNGGGRDGVDDESKSSKLTLRGLSKDSIVVISNDVDYHSVVRVKLGGRISSKKQPKEKLKQQKSQPTKTSTSSLSKEQNCQTPLEHEKLSTTTATVSSSRPQHAPQKAIHLPDAGANNGPAQVSLSPPSQKQADRTTTTPSKQPSTMPPPPPRRRKRKHMLSLSKQRQLSQEKIAVRKGGDGDDGSNDVNDDTDDNNGEPPSKRTRTIMTPQSRPAPTKIIPGSTIASSSSSYSKKNKTAVAPVHPGRETTTTTRTNHHVSKKNRVASPLRVNNNFMFSGDDYDDGERINLSTFDSSPRGLKRLFKKMSQGERI